MITTIQVDVIRQWIVDSIADCPELVPVALDRVVKQRQNFPDRAYPYVLYGYTGAAEIGLSPSQTVNNADDMVTLSQYDTTMSITVFSKVSDTAPSADQEASSYVRELTARLRSFAGEPLRLAGLAIRAVNIVPDVSEIEGKSEFVSQAVLDVTWGAGLAVTEGPGIIVNAEIDGSTEPPTPNRTILAG